jgi:radical SAM protein with 4Fe4S-binding SPASM domain
MDPEEHKPSLIAFEVTRRCMYTCRHCRANAYSGAREEELSTRHCSKILAGIARFVYPFKKKSEAGPKGDGCRIILTGGEPMERHDIYELIAHGRALGLRMVMATCGYLIGIDSIGKLKQAGIQALSFSLDGSSAETHDKFRGAEGAFDAVVGAAELARQAGVPFQINTTISRINVEEVIGIAELAEKLGARCFNPFILVPTGRGAEIKDAVLDPVEYEALLGELLKIKLKGEIDLRVTCAPQFARVCEQAKERHLVEDVSGCMGGRGFGFISYRGDVQTCGFLDVPAGNLVENGFNFEKIWVESVFLKGIRDRSRYRGACGDCEYVGVCGGCRARALAMCGDYLGADAICGHPQSKSRAGKGREKVEGS